MYSRRFRTYLHLALDAWCSSLAAFCLLGLLRSLFTQRPDWNWIWVSGRPLPTLAVQLILAAFASSALLRAPSARPLALLVAALCSLDALRVLGAAAEPNGPTLGCAVPASVALAFLFCAYAFLGPLTWPRSRRAQVGRLTLAGAAGLGAILVHVLIVGSTRADASRGDAVVVLGAKVHADGHMSGALEDRTNTACDLVLQDESRRRLLILSGGRNPDAPLSEPAAMARRCTERGIPSDQVLLDETGQDTQSTVRAVRKLATERGWSSVLVVSHDYHLARLQVAFRDAGLRAHTVPCRETHNWPGKPLAVLREVAAFIYYLCL